MRSSAPQACGDQAFPVLKALSRHAQCALFPMRRDLSPSPAPVRCSHTREADVVSTVFPHHRNRCVPVAFPHHQDGCSSGVPAPLELWRGPLGGSSLQLPVQCEGETLLDTQNMSPNRPLSRRIDLFWRFSRATRRNRRDRECPSDLISISESRL